MKAATYIRRLIAAGKSREALRLLTELTEQEIPELAEELALLSGSLVKTLADRDRGVLSRQEEILALNKLNLSISEIAGQLPAHVEVPVSKAKTRTLSGRAFVLRYYPFLLLGIWALLIGTFIFLSTKAQDGVDIEMDVRSSQLSMQTKNDEKLYIERDISGLQLSRFREVSISAEKLRLTMPSGELSQDQLIRRGWISLYPQKNIEADLFLESVMLKSLSFRKGTDLSMSLPESQDHNLPQVEIKLQPGIFKGELSFHDSLSFQAGNVIIDTAGTTAEPATVQFASATAYIPEHEALPVTIESDGDQFQMLLELKPGAGHTIEESNLLVDSVSFLRPDGPGKAKSSVLGGQIRFLNGRREAYSTAQIDSLDFVRIVALQPLQIMVFSLQEKAIYLRLHGRVHSVMISTNMIDWSDQNPSVFTWIRKDKPVYLYIPLFLLLLLSVGVVIFARNSYRL